MAKNLAFLLILFCSVSVSQQKSSWQIWIVPNTYNLNEGDTLHLVFGLTGYGPLDPINLKVAAYSEANTLIKYDAAPGQFDTYLIAPDNRAPKDRFTKKDPGANPDQIILQSDHNSEFGHLFLIPKSSGDKKLTLAATYSPDGISWYTTSRDFGYHVNSFTEQYQTLLTLLTIFFGILGIPIVGRLISALESRLKT